MEVGLDSVSVTEWILLCGAAIAAGIVNAVAGGGTLLTFPALVWVLGPTAAASVVANATSTITVFPGSMASAWGYRRELFGMRRWILPLIIPSILGSCVGAWLVAERPPEEFLKLVPWLILLATLLFLLQPTIGRWIGIGRPRAPKTNDAIHSVGGQVLETSAEHKASMHAVEAIAVQTPNDGLAYRKTFSAKAGLTRLHYGLMVFQFFIALYGGYFGAGIGILMLSTLALMGISDIHDMNSLKSLLAGTINGTAVFVFAGVGKVDWRLAIPMIVASIIGGFLGAVVARRLNKNLVRYGVVIIGITLATYYFIGTYLR